jgi:hypothetical protein
MGKTPATAGRARILGDGGEMTQSPLKGVAKLWYKIVALNWEFMRNLLFGKREQAALHEISQI